MRVSPDVQARLEKLQGLRGATSLSEAATDAMLAGLEGLEGDAYSADNKRLINQRLRAKVEGAIDAVEALEGVANELSLMAGRDGSVEEIRGIAARFKTWLSE